MGTSATTHGCTQMGGRAGGAREDAVLIRRGADGGREGMRSSAWLGTRQQVHALCCAALTLQSIEPRVLEYLPGGQGSHDSWPGSLFQVPLGLAGGAGKREEGRRE